MPSAQEMEGTVVEGDTAAETVANALPITGELSADIWNEDDQSVAKDIPVEDFMAMEMADRFYQLWKSGKITDRFVGSDFGYGVLGRFYGKHDWGKECIQSSEEAANEGGAPPQNEQGMIGSGGCGDAESVEPTSARVDGADPAASALSTSAGSAGASTTEGHEPQGAGVLTGSRQTSLSRWLL